MLEIERLTKLYPGGIHALREIDLTFSEGMFGLLGPNGAGKSTLMKIIAGLLEPTSGSLRLDGRDLVADPSYVRARLGYLPQDFGLNPELTGEEMLIYLLRLKGVDAPKGVRHLAHELLERVNLSAARGRKVGTYSGGMRQRVGIAQAIAGDPRLVVVDEPTVGLDPAERNRLYGLLAELAQSRIVLLSTHIVEDIGVLCPRFALIQAGQVVADTTPRDAVAPLEGSCFEGAVGTSDLAALRKRFLVTRAFLVAGEHRVRIHAPDGAPPSGFSPVTPTLEDAYHLLLAEPKQATSASEVAA